MWNLTRPSQDQTVGVTSAWRTERALVAVPAGADVVDLDLCAGLGCLDHLAVAEVERDVCGAEALTAEVHDVAGQ